jgi:hypothetical protein
LTKANHAVPEPHQVFTPTRAPLKSTNVYVSRGDAEEELRSAVSQGFTPVIFGEFGVGKTSLALVHFREQASAGRLIHYTNPENKSLDDVYKQALEHLGYAVEVSREQGRGTSVGAEVEGGLWATIKAKVSTTATTSSASVTELVVKSPTDAGILNLLSEQRMVILIDELHRADSKFKSDLVRLIKSLSDRGTDYPVLVIAGTSTQPEQLVQMDQGVDRLLREVPIRPLTEEESREIVTTGFDRLKIEIAPDVRERIVRTAAGAPSLLHAICLDAAISARERSATSLTDVDVDGAVRKVVKRTYHRLTERYMKATNTMGVKRYRARILRACAEAEGDFITMEMLVPKVSEYVGEPVPRTRLSEPLRQLKSEEFGSILSDVQRADGEGRHYNLTVFSDPQMKAYVRFMTVVDEQGLLEEGDAPTP